jgi:uncharacterized protein (DUF924 family)
LSEDWRSDILRFWFGLDPKEWWNGGAELDHRIRQQFLKLWSEKRQLPVDAFLGDPLTALAGVVLFDQLPRNMFRGNAEQFATDHLALAIAKAAIDNRFDEQLSPRNVGSSTCRFSTARISPTRIGRCCCSLASAMPGNSTMR